MLFNAIKTAATLATRGIPAIRAAVHGARIGAGKSFTRSTIETLGIKVAAAAPAAVNRAGAPIEAIVSKAGSATIVRIGSFTRNGISLRMSPTGAVAATVSEEMVSMAARGSVRTAMATIGRATAAGALGGAAFDAVVAGVSVIPGLRNGTISRTQAAQKVGKRAARGALAGGAGVAAAGAISAAIAATGITIAGAPVVIPFIAMVAMGALASRQFDRQFGTS